MSELERIIEFMGRADTIPELLSHSAGRYRHQTAVEAKQDGERLQKTYLQLKSDSDALSAALEARGLSQKHVAFIGGLSYEWLVAFFGVTGSGNIAVPIDKDLSLADLVTLVLQADISMLFVDSSQSHIVEQIGRSCEALEVIVCFQAGGPFSSITEFIRDTRCSEKLRSTHVAADQAAMIVFTSSETGGYKGAMLSHRNICHNIICSVYLAGMEAFEPGGCTVVVLPPHHMFAVTSGMLVPLLFYGLTLCLSGGLSGYLSSIQQFRPSLLFMVPMLVEGMYKRISREAARTGQLNLEFFGGQLRTIICGGAYLDAELVEKYKQLGITLLNGYGITECSPLVSCNRPYGVISHSVGLVGPEPYCQVRIKDDEIQVQGSIVMKQYYKDCKSTEEAFDQGWFKTGDLGYLDQHNYLYITGRKKDLIILKDGNNISPVGIEQSIEQHPLVEQSLVYADDKKGAEMLVAIIHPDYDYAANNGFNDVKLALDDLIQALNNNSPAFKRIRRIEVSEKPFDKLALKKALRAPTRITREKVNHD